MEIILNNLAKRYLVDISNSAEKHEHGKFANIRFKFHASPSLSILFPTIPPPSSTFYSLPLTNIQFTYLISAGLYQRSDRREGVPGIPGGSGRIGKSGQDRSCRREVERRIKYKPFSHNTWSCYI